MDVVVAADGSAHLNPTRPVRSCPDTGGVSFHTHHGPSFQRLYGDTPNRRLVEACDWYSSLDETYPDPPAWAEVVLDYRINRASHRQQQLPTDIGAPTLVWESQMPGWALEGFTVRGQNRHTQVLRFTDPEGFRGAFVLSGKEGNDTDRMKGRFAEWGFETGRFTHLFPTADVDLLTAIQPPPGSMRSPHARPEFAPLREPAAARDSDPTDDRADERTGDEPVPASRRYHLPVLRDALRDPAGWFGHDPSTGTAWQDMTCGPSSASIARDATHEGTAAQFPDAMGPDCPVSPDRVLVSYAMAGHTSYAPVARFVEAGLDAAELARWRDGDIGKGRPGRYAMSDEEIVEWFAVVGGGGKARRHAIAFYAAGVCPALAQRWKVLGDTPSSYADHIAVFEDAGWTPEDVLAMVAAVAGASPDPLGWRPPVRRYSCKDAAEWTFTTAQAAVDFHTCGYTAAQAQALCDEAEDVALVHASMAAMAMLRRPLASAAPSW